MIYLIYVAYVGTPMMFACHGILPASPSLRLSAPLRPLPTFSLSISLSLFFTLLPHPLSRSPHPSLSLFFSLSPSLSLLPPHPSPHSLHPSLISTLHLLSLALSLSLSLSLKIYFSLPLLPPSLL